jgi:hypothetical protein
MGEFLDAFDIHDRQTISMNIIICLSIETNVRYGRMEQSGGRLQALPIVDRQYEHVELVCTIPM